MVLHVAETCPRSNCILFETYLSVQDLLMMARHYTSYGTSLDSVGWFGIRNGQKTPNPCVTFIPCYMSKRCRTWPCLPGLTTVGYRMYDYLGMDGYHICPTD